MHDGWRNKLRRKNISQQKREDAENAAFSTLRLCVSALFLLALAAVLFISCGKKTAPSPPVPIVPGPAGEPRVTQSGDSLLFSFKLPLLNTDEKTLAEFGKIVIFRYKAPRIVPTPATQTVPTQSAPTQSAPAQSAPTQSAPTQSAPAQTAPTQSATQTQTQTQTVPATPETARSIATTEFEDLAEKLIEIPPDKIDSYIRDDYFVFQDKRELQTGSEDLQNWFYYGVILYSKKNKENQFGRLAALFPDIVPEPPKQFIAAVSEKKIQLTWAPVTKDIAGNSVAAESVAYDIFRGSSANLQPVIPINQTPVTSPTFEDTTYQFGRPYYYFVRAYLTTQRHDQESAPSNVLFIFPQDIYPPTAPQELNVVAAREGMVLIWAPNPEEDVAGYNVFRKVEGEQDYTKINKQLVRETTFSDLDIKPGLKYYYQVSAIDSAPVPNESPRSAEVFEVKKTE